MALTYVELDSITRTLMQEEIQLDISLGKLYQGKRLTTYGLQDWPGAFLSAAQVGIDDSLAVWLQQVGRLETQEPYTRNGVTRMRTVPATAAQTFAEGEFNRFYIRAICRKAIQAGCKIQAYRARYSENPRAESIAIEGRLYDPSAVLADLRENTSVDGINTALGLPSGPNSGMSVRLAR